MGGLLAKLALRFVKGRWGSILPAVFKAVASGSAGPTLAKIYWAVAKFKTVTGAVLWGLGAAAETVCGNYPQYAWACKVAPYVYWLGLTLTGIGLADGGTRSPWPTTPDGKAPFPVEEKKA